MELTEQSERGWSWYRRGVTPDDAILGVIMPVFNEAKAVNEIMSRVLAQPNVCELIAVDDGSNDGTVEILHRWLERDRRLQVLEHRINLGKGAAIRTGLTAVKAPVVVIQDADLEYDPLDYAPMLELILKGQADVVYGSRFSANRSPSNPFWHTFGNRFATWFSNAASGMQLTDEATCYKMFRREVLQRITIEENGFGFCPEVTAKLAKLGVCVREVPISYHRRTRAEGKKFRVSKDCLATLRCIAKKGSVLSIDN